VPLQVIRSARANYPVESYVGDKGQIFYREDIGDFRLSDGVTPGGIPLTSGGFSAEFINNLPQVFFDDVDQGDFFVLYDDSEGTLKKIRSDNLPKGFTGSQGNEGVAGDQGFTGSVGSQGELGYTGSRGIPGPRGFVGSQGDQGIQGGLGYTGSRGEDGLIGRDGYTGSQGEIGYTGSGAASNLIFSESNGNRILTNYRDDDGETFTVRTTAISNGVLTLSLASFTPTLSSSVVPSNTLNWDVPAQGFSVNVTNPTDFTTRYISSVRSLTQTQGSVSTDLEDYTTSGPSSTPAGGISWQQTFTVSGNSFIRSNSVSISGGTAAAQVRFNEFSSGEIEYTASTTTWTVTWNTPSLSASVVTLNGNNFLQTYISTSYAIAVTGMSNTANYSLSVTGNGGTVSNPASSGTFTFTSPVHKNNVSETRTVSVSGSFNRPASVTGTAYTSTLNATSASVPANFTYPSFWVFTPSVSEPPQRTDVVAVSSFKAGVTVLGNQIRVFAAVVNNSDSIPKVFWFGVRSTAAQPSSFKTGASVSLLSDVQITASSVGLSPDTVPLGYITENYSLYGIILQPGNTYVSIS